ncbi:MAG: asparagine synthase (glutamine-hydrolyzing) [Thermoguttaceae bacterium]|nr:asparagine synthase (glutamine-hydrolyzing) [Thermoguttaceae bacterium]
MCGICGAVGRSRVPVSPETLDAMVDSLTHRGPDDRGTLLLSPGQGAFSSRAGAALGHRRLSIIDLSSAGRQPLANEDGSVWVTFNGEIYNYLELRRELLEKGHRFKTDTDTEVLVHLYEETGLDFPKRLEGMFAIAVWDARKEQLVLVRDRLGKKPLFYWRTAEELYFASELKALTLLPGFPRTLDPIALEQYFAYQYIPAPRTIWRDARKLPPAHLAVWTPQGRWSQERYWEIDFNREERFTSAREWSERLRSALEESVRRRLRSDVPLGAFLSGGVDSTIIVSLMQKLSDRPIKTFSIGFEQKEYDETALAAATAKRLGTEHTELIVTPDARAIFPQIVAQYDEPYSDSSAIPTWYLCQMTRRHVTVALSGDGGDELFAGYDRYKAVKLAGALDFFPEPIRRFLAGPVRAMIPASISQRSILRRMKRFLEAVGMSPLERYLQWIAIFNRQRLGRLFSNRFREVLRQAYEEEGEEPNPLTVLQAAFARADRRDFATAISVTDLLTYLPGDILTKVDIASMRFALEVRCPMLDTGVVELAARLPIALKMRATKGKLILRETFREYLPPDLEKQPKRGFGVPLDHWFRGPLSGDLRDALLSCDSPCAAYLNPEYTRELVEQHLAAKFDHAGRLWSLLVFNQWLKGQALSGF